MQDAPIYEIDLEAFWQDPYPDLKRMRRECPVAFVPQLGAVLLTRRDDIFDRPDVFDLTQNASASVAFGAGPHYCAGAAASSCLIADVAVPRLFDRLPDLRLAGEVEFGGWAFRGPLSMPVAWN